VNQAHGWRRDLFLGLLVSLISGLLLALGAKILTITAPALTARGVPVWLSIAVVAVTAFIAFALAHHLNRRTPQVFMVISAFVQTNWLAGLLDNVVWSLDRHNIDLVVKLPPHDYSGQSQILQLSRLCRKRRSYIGGLIIAAQPELVKDELTSFCKSCHLPTVFVDVRPFSSGDAYPPGTAFVGCNSEEIGERAAQWVAKEMLERGNKEPAILVVGGEAQEGRHVRFEARIRETLPSSTLSINLLGQFSRERARDIVDQHIRQLHRRGDHLDVIYCTNDQMALGAVDAAQGQAVAGNRQDGLVIVGVDGTDEAVAAIKSGATPFKATIVQDTRRVAETAVDVLLRLRAGQNAPTETRIPTTIYPMQ
jgi:ribose transport system substrate-binding protein